MFFGTAPTLEKAQMLPEYNVYAVFYKKPGGLKNTQIFMSLPLIVKRTFGVFKKQNKTHVKFVNVQKLQWCALSASEHIVITSPVIQLYSWA